MTQRDDSVSLRQMLDHGREAIRMVERRSRDELGTDRMFALALIQLVQIVGEAAQRVSALCRDRHPQVPWSQIIGLRNRLIHGYDSVDYDILWRIVTLDLPALVTSLQTVVDDTGPSFGVQK